jgi:predicted esterase
MPTVDGWEQDLSDPTSTRVFIAHGANDPVIGLQFARRAHEVLAAHGFQVDYRESNAMHNIDPDDVPRAVAWLEETLAQ